jgi:hypothetical protein
MAHAAGFLVKHSFSGFRENKSFQYINCGTKNPIKTDSGSQCPQAQMPEKPKTTITHFNNSAA